MYAQSPVMSDSLRPHGLYPARLLCSWDSPGKNTGVGIHFLLQGIFPTQGWNRDLLHCRQILYWLSQEGSPCFTVNTTFHSAYSEWARLQAEPRSGKKWECKDPTLSVHQVHDHIRSQIKKIFPNEIWAKPSCPLTPDFSQHFGVVPKSSGPAWSCGCSPPALPFFCGWGDATFLQVSECAAKS